MTNEQKIAQLEEQLKIAESKDNGGRDVELYRKAEDSVNRFDLSIAKETLEALSIETTMEQRETVKQALIDRRYVLLLNNKKSTAWV